MPEDKIKSFRELFLSRLSTLSHIIDISSEHLQKEADSILGYRLIDDMLPLGTQIAYACNQPRNFALWCEGAAMENLSADVESLSEARKIIDDTRSKLISVTVNDEKLQEVMRIDIGEEQYIELPGLEYVNDFLIPNLYFHLVTAYNIMRMKGVPVGKFDYMIHLAPKVKQT
ncbi:MAG: DUF1993 domain-containing protein [Pseudomonadales bacterium]|nr:DUF1993 domain-containing protein [Pseudomonadales bacterium]MCP5171263.1 DUF1993 domain-containing protein [Pseudomonadales bacterium]